MSREPESLTEETLMEDGYWTSHRYHKMYRDVHGHEPWQSCPPNCLGRVYTVTADGELRSPAQRWHDRCPRCVCGSHRHAGECAPEYKHPEDPSDSLMDLFRQYDEMEIPE